MKTPDGFLADVRRRLGTTWHTVADTSTVSQPPWPHHFSLGTPTKVQLESDFSRYLTAALAWRDWSTRHGIDLIDAPRVVHGTSQRLPTHVVVPDIDAAARLAGPDWVARIGRARARAARLRNEFPANDAIVRLVRDIDQHSEVDFELLVVAARWFTQHTAAGLTPRQVPVPGLHAKWLNHRHRHVTTLVGITDLQLLPAHPQRIHFTYLDPQHREAGRRQHDSATVGDTMTPAYPPTFVVISENKDTALHFPQADGGISVEGVGFGGATIAAIDWIRTCPNLFYWGDIDAAGLEILNGFREAGLTVTSILMDPGTYDQYEIFGTATDVRGNLIPHGRRRAVPYLTNTEIALYNDLTDPDWRRHRRVEQEKIPLHIALQTIQTHLPPGKGGSEYGS